MNTNTLERLRNWEIEGLERDLRDIENNIDPRTGEDITNYRSEHRIRSQIISHINRRLRELNHE